MAMEKERIENFRYQQRSKELEKAVTPFLKGRFQNEFVALNGHLIVQSSMTIRHLIGRDSFLLEGTFLKFKISTI